MRLGYNGLTTKDTTLEEDIRFSAKAGFDVVELREYKIDQFLASNSVNDIRKLIAECGVSVEAINSMEIESSTFVDSTAFFQKFDRLLEYAAALGAPYVVVAPMVNESNTDMKTLYGQLEDLFCNMSDRAARVNSVRIGLEFIGLPGAMIKTLDQAITLVRRINRPNVGLVVDTFAFFANGSRTESIGLLRPGELCMVHLNDSKYTKGPFKESFRTYPGEGKAPLETWIRAIRATGFNGAFTVELIDPEIWEQEPWHVVQHSYQAIKAITDRFQ